MSTIQNSPVFTQLSNAIEVLQRCQHSTRILETSAFQSIIDGLARTEKRTVNLLEKHMRLQNRLKFHDFRQLKADAEKIHGILETFHESLENLVPCVTESVSSNQRLTHQRLLMEIRLLLEDHNNRLQRLIVSNSGGTGTTILSWPGTLLALFVWILVYFLSILTGTGAAYSMVLSLVFGSRTLSLVLSVSKETGAGDSLGDGENPETRYDVEVAHHSEPSARVKDLKQRISNYGGIRHSSRIHFSEWREYTERTYFIPNKTAAREVIIADLQFYFKERVMVTPANEHVWLL